MNSMDDGRLTIVVPPIVTPTGTQTADFRRRPSSTVGVWLAGNFQNHNFLYSLYSVGVFAIFLKIVSYSTIYSGILLARTNNRRTKRMLHF